jgi:hypothetical protein
MILLGWGRVGWRRWVERVDGAGAGAWLCWVRKGEDERLLLAMLLCYHMSMAVS